MNQVYQSHGVCFRYPEDWDLSEEEQEQDVQITVTSPTTSFWSLFLLHERPEIEDAIESAVDAFREEYDNFDIYPVETELCQCETIGRDIEFVCLELINCASLRAFQTDDFTAILLFQATDKDLPEVRPVFDLITESLRCQFENDMGGSLFPEPEIAP